MEAAFFDLDKTIIARSSGLAFGRDLYKEGFITKRLLLKGVAAQFVYLLVGADENKMEQMREKVLDVTKGWEKAKVQSLIEEVMGDVITPIIFKEAVDLIDEHKAQDRKVFIVSSSPEEIVVPLGHLLDIDAVIASRGKVDEEGRYVGELEFYCYGPHKIEAINQVAQEQGIDLSKSYAYSDSITDLPMLEAVGFPVAVNPDRALRKEAQDRGWDIRTFSKPVTLRSRLADFAPSQRTTMLSGGVALGVAAAAAGYVWMRRRLSTNA
ncbi:MAG: HAD-IB family hydrolase [Actinobacteria bacterium]|nr:HAD-IB family hydrolase [Actinomycetota bacterium]